MSLGRRGVVMAQLSYGTASMSFGPTGSPANGVLGGNVVSTLTGHFMDVSCCHYNPLKCELYTGSADGHMLIWDYQKGMNENVIFTDTWSDEE